MASWVCTGVCICIDITLYSGSAKRDMLTDRHKIRQVTVTV